MSLLGKVGGILKGAAKGVLGGIGGGKGGLIGGAIGGAIGSMGGKKPSSGGTPPLISSSDVGIKRRVASDDPESGGIYGQGKRLSRSSELKAKFMPGRSMSGRR